MRVPECRPKIPVPHPLHDRPWIDTRHERMRAEGMPQLVHSNLFGYSSPLARKFQSGIDVVADLSDLVRKYQLTPQPPRMLPKQPLEGRIDGDSP